MNVEMKRILIILFAVAGLWSCEKDEIRAVMNEGVGTNVAPARGSKTPSQVGQKESLPQVASARWKIGAL